MKFILFCDLDGTLVEHHSYKVNKENVHTIDNFVSRGNKFVIATGRWMNRVFPIIKTINSKNININYVISLAGAYIYDANAKKAIYKQSIELDIFNDLRRSINDNNLPGIVYSDESLNSNSVFVFKLKHKWLLSKFAGSLSFKSIDKDTIINNAYKVVIPFLTRNKRNKILKILQPLKNNLNIMPQNHYIEILQKDTDKATAANFLIKYLEINNFLKAAIGDSANDLNLLNSVHRSFIVSSNPYKSQLNNMNLPIINNKNHVAVTRILNLLMKEQEGLDK